MQLQTLADSFDASGIVSYIEGPPARRTKAFDRYAPWQLIFVFPGRKAHLVDAEPVEQSQTKSAHQPFEKTETLLVFKHQARIQGQVLSPSNTLWQTPG